MRIALEDMEAKNTKKKRGERLDIVFTTKTEI